MKAELRASPIEARGEKIFTLPIESLLHGERGVARLAGRAVFVPFVVPGDRVSLRIVRSRRRYVEAELVEVVEPSKDRRDVPCPHYGRCGGCHWLHIEYPAQLAAKERNLLDCMRRLGRLEPRELLPPVASPEEFEYRHRVRLRGRIRKGRLEVGFLAPGSHRVVPHERCWLYRQEIRHLLGDLSDALPEGCDGSLQIVAALGGQRQDLFFVLPRQDLAEHCAEAFRRIESRWQCSWEVHCEQTGTSIRSEAPRRIAYELDGARGPLAIFGAARAFMQSNVTLNRELVAEVLRWAALEGKERVLDLYGGNGNFTVPLATTGASVCSVETDPEAVALARENFRLSEGRATMVEGHAEEIVKDWATAGRGFDLVLIDPPRRGARDLVEPLLALAPKRILYVSCEPSTLARDLAPLVAGGYEFTRLRLFDMFPQTHHLESLAELVRRS